MSVVYILAGCLVNPDQWFSGWIWTLVWDLKCRLGLVRPEYPQKLYNMLYDMGSDS